VEYGGNADGGGELIVRVQLPFSAAIHADWRFDFEGMVNDPVNFALEDD